MINWKTNASPSTNSWSTANPFQPPLSPDFRARYLVNHSLRSSSIKLIVSSNFERWDLQNWRGRPYIGNDRITKYYSNAKFNKVIIEFIVCLRKKLCPVLQLNIQYIVFIYFVAFHVNLRNEMNIPQEL